MKRFGIFLLSFLLLSCQHIKENKKPENLISKDTMSLVLTDFALFNSANNYNRRLLEETGLNPEEYLFNKYNIDSSQFRLSTEYYAKNYDDYQQIYKKVKSNLEDLKDKYQKIEDEEEKKKQREFEQRYFAQDTLGYNKVRLET